jgi:branched-chain amino acid transport system permease protein
MPSKPNTIVRAIWPVASLCVLVIVAAILGSLGPASLDQTVMTNVVTLVLVVGVYAFVGTSGVVSLGHMSFMAIGGYTAGILTIPAAVKPFQLAGLPDFLLKAEMGAVPATLIAGVVAAVAALVISPALMRMSGLTAGLATVSLLLIVRVVAQSADNVTGGSAGLSGIPVNATLGMVVAWAIVAIILVAVFQASAIGLRLRSSREDEVAARSLGIGVIRERTIAFVLSAFLVGVGGALFVQVIGTATPDQFYLSITFLVIAMLVVGGVNSLAGAVLGTIVLSVALELLRRVEEGASLGFVDIPGRPGLSAVGLALMLLVMLALRPEGLTRGRELRLPRILGGRSVAAPGPDGGDGGTGGPPSPLNPASAPGTRAAA